MATTVERPGTRFTGGPAEEPEELTPARPSFFERPAGLASFTIEQLSWFALVGIAFAMRIWDVGKRAMHHDESMHAFYSLQLLKGGGYKYDPMLHGPFQFHGDAFMMW